MDLTRLSLLDAIRHLLELEAGGDGGTSAQDAGLATRLYEKLARHLSPAVGEEGLDALFSRGIKLTRPVFPCLRELETTGTAESVRTLFFEHLGKQDPAVVAAVTESLMMTFVSTLSTFIGHRLTWQLLRNAWPDLPSEPPSEKAQ